MEAFGVSTLKSELENSGERWREFLRVPSLSAGLYCLPAGAKDLQHPHAEDEIYYVIRGRARFRAGRDDRNVGPGTVLFVPARAQHCFHSIRKDLVLLVVFGPAEGTRKNVAQGDQAMAENTQQYIQRLLGYVGKQKPLSVLKSTPARVERLLRGVPAQKIRRRPAPGKWSVREIVLHLADSELVYGYRLRTILAQNRARIIAFDQNDWAASGRYALRDLRAALDMLRTLRKANLELLRAIPRRQWNYYGVHQERGKESVAHMARLYAGHDMNHLLQIRRILGAR